MYPQNLIQVFFEGMQFDYTKKYIIRYKSQTPLGQL